MASYFTETRTRKYVNGYWFLLFLRKYWKHVLDTGLDVPKTTSKKVAHKAAEATCEFIGNKIADKI